MPRKPNLLLKILASAFMLVLTLIVQSNQENNIPSILVILGIGLGIFCTVQKFYLVTDFGLSEFFIRASAVIIFNIYGLKCSQMLVFSMFCLVLIGVNYWIERKLYINARPRCFMDVSIGKIPVGRIVFELYEDLAPNTVRNFKSFCMEGHYKKTIFHQISGYSVIGGEELSSVNDSGIIKKLDRKHNLYHIGENSRLQHDEAGLLSAPLKIRGSKFLVTRRACPEYNINNMVFGKVVKGMGLLKEIEKVTTDKEYRPVKPVEIIRCGEIFESDAENDFSNLFGEKDRYPDWPQDMIKKEKEFTWWLVAIGTLQTFGSAAKKMRFYERAVVKYKKALRYLEVCSTDDSIQKASDGFLDAFKFELSKEINECLLKLGESTTKLMKNPHT